MFKKKKKVLKSALICECVYFSIFFFFFRVRTEWEVRGH